MGDKNISLQPDWFHRHMQEMGYVYKATIGSGVDGVVEKYHNNYGESFIIKRPHVAENNFEKNEDLQSLWDSVEKKGWKGNRLNLLQPLKVNGKRIAQIGRYESYIDSNMKNQIIERSDNLGSFFKNTFHPLYEHQKTGPKIQLAFHGQGLGMLLAQLTQGVHEAADEMHKKRFLHRDIAARNILVRLKYDDQGNVIAIEPVLADFDKVGRLKKRGQFIDYNEKKHGVFPIKTTDSNFYKNKQFSICTDFFAEKATLIGILGMALASANQPEQLIFRSNNTQYIKQRKEQYQSKANGFENDEEVLQQYLDNIIQLVDSNKNTPEIDEISLFLKHYHKYLTTMPDTYDLKKATKQQHKLLLKANTTYVAERYRQLMAAQKLDKNDEHTLLQLQRLQQITISDPKLQQKITLEQEKFKGKVIAKNNRYVKQEYHKLMTAFAKDLNYDALNRGLKPLRTIEISDKKLKKKISEQGIKQKLHNPIALAKLGAKFSLTQLKQKLKALNAQPESLRPQASESLQKIQQDSNKNAYALFTKKDEIQLEHHGESEAYLASEVDISEEAVVGSSIALSQESIIYNNGLPNEYGLTPAFQPTNWELPGKFDIYYPLDFYSPLQTKTTQSGSVQNDVDEQTLEPKRKLMEKYKSEIHAMIPQSNPKNPDEPPMLSKL